MKLIRIGSSPTSDLQLTSSYVSSTHAEITLLDGGDIILEDAGGYYSIIEDYIDQF